ncbi:hypothetical protein [Streptomyces nogalater]|uniref:Uncharacterized protein n=1 Tax=Streptomyces nogalater TaxID=38314 RepID=A0ABW0WEH7_STRNO
MGRPPQNGAALSPAARNASTAVRRSAGESAVTRSSSPPLVIAATPEP